MSERAISEESRKFYEQFQFPGSRPIDQDGLIFLRRFTKSIESCSSQARVLDAGCGTGNTTVSLARRFKDAEFIGIDQSRNSLDKAKSSADRYGLKNLHFRKWNLMKSLSYLGRFDIVLCLGVLHHTANMKKGLVRLRSSLKNNGELYLWVYGKHGRYRHSLNMRLLHMLLETNPKSPNNTELVREFVRGGDDGSVLSDLVGNTRTDVMQTKTFEDPVWLADQFLNPVETPIDMEELIELVYSSGFALQQVLGMNVQASDYLKSPSLLERFDRLNRIQRLIALDLMAKPRRYFILLRKVGRKKHTR
jgi:2-polyprenyl-3-methyl-5-hydroxy-6-metoxy-1,4-benzoquinol methylase